jgi:hypothetical protein
MDSEILHGTSRLANVKLPPCSCLRIEVDPEGSTIQNDGIESTQDEDSLEIRWRQSAHADLRLHEDSPVGDVLHCPISAFPSVRSWTSIITVDIDVGSDGGTADVIADGVGEGVAVICIDGVADGVADRIIVGVGVGSFLAFDDTVGGEDREEFKFSSSDWTPRITGDGVGNCVGVGAIMGLADSAEYSVDVDIIDGTTNGITELNCCN